MLIDKKENILNDNIAFVEYHDFSTANTDDDWRVATVTRVASICYNTDGSVGKQSLFNRLASEAAGLPSTSFEYIPVLFEYEDIEKRIVLDSNGVYNITDTNMLKYGIKIEVDYVTYLLTNYRAVVYDFEKLGIDYRDTYNSSRGEQQIIKDNFKVFLMMIDLPTFGQAVRHRVNWQVNSRRYTSGKKLPFSFYISEKMSKLVARHILVNQEGHSQTVDVTTQDAIDMCLSVYFKAIESGVKAEDARRIIPQAAYTRAWCAMNIEQYNNFIKLRTDTHAQAEIRLLAKAMLEMVSDNKTMIG